MILNIKIDNISGIKNEVNLNFIAQKNDKINLKSVYELPDSIWVNRIAGIIAGNAHGKTTILDSIASIGSFIDLPLRKKNIPSINDMELNAYKEEYKEKIFKNMISDFTSLDLLAGNKLNSNHNSKIEIELYIGSKSEDIRGYYLYGLEYSDDYLEKGISKEYLKYKNRYKKNYTTLFDISGHFESEIGYKIAYEQNIKNELLSNNVDVSEFEKKIKYYKTFRKHYNKDSSIICADNYIFPEFYIIDMLKNHNNNNDLLNFIKLADCNVRKMYIDEENVDKPKIIFEYDSFSLGYNDLSTATKKLLSMAYSILETNKKNGIFLIDELDNSLNYEIAKFLIDSFYEKNNCMSQMIFTTNNPEFLNDLRRDQIFLILKNKFDVDIKRFYDFVDPITGRRVRNDFSFSKAYRKNIIENFPSKSAKQDVINDLNK